MVGWTFQNIFSEKSKNIREIARHNTSHVELISASFLGRRRLHINPRECGAKQTQFLDRLGAFAKAPGVDEFAIIFVFQATKTLQQCIFMPTSHIAHPVIFLWQLTGANLSLSLLTRLNKQDFVPFPLLPPSSIKALNRRRSVRSFAICVYLGKRKRGRGCPSNTGAYKFVLQFPIE